MPDTKEIESRLVNFLDVFGAVKGRAESTQSTEELAEIGFLTMRLTALEDLVSLYCEILLVRPEVSELNTQSGPVSNKGFSDKLKIYRKLITKIGDVYGSDTEPIKKNITTLREVAEDRNAIVHGLLSERGDGQNTFRKRSREVQGTFEGLISLSKRCKTAAFHLDTYFFVFYSQLIAHKSTIPEFEKSVLRALPAVRSFQGWSYYMRERQRHAKDMKARY